METCKMIMGDWGYGVNFLTNPGHRFWIFFFLGGGREGSVSG